MPGDVCPVDKLRCATAVMCATFHCAKSFACKPIMERDLNQGERYALAMDDKRKGQAQS